MRDVLGLVSRRKRTVVFALSAVLGLALTGCGGTDDVVGPANGAVGDASGGDSAGQLGDGQSGDSLGGADTGATDDAALVDSSQDAAAGSDTAGGSDAVAGSDATQTDSTTTSACLSALPCIEACEKTGTSSQQCFGQCLVDLPADAQNQFVAFAGCLGEGKFEADPTCIDKVNACVQSSGSGGCMDFLSCTQDCQASGGDPGVSCLTNCLQIVAPAKTATVLGAMSCFGKEDTACQQKIAACFTDTTGSKSCGEVALCGGKCKEGDAQCGFACLKSGSSAAVGEWLQVQQCFDDQQQASSLCNGIIGKCLGIGSGSCNDGLTCITSCEDSDSPDCFFTCLTTLTSASASQLMAAGQCFDGKYAQTCPADIASCIAPKGNKACWGVISCLQQSQCGPDNFACSKPCWEQADKKGLEDFVAATHCMDECKAKCTPAGDKACEDACMSSCGGQFPGCLPPG